MFEIIVMLFPLAFLAGFGLAVAGLVIHQVNRGKIKVSYSGAPRLTVDAKVISKRTQSNKNNTKTQFYATFQFESGDQLEMQLTYDQFAALVEGNVGKLTLKGMKFIEFQRNQFNVKFER